MPDKDGRMTEDEQMAYDAEQYERQMELGEQPPAKPKPKTKGKPKTETPEQPPVVEADRPTMESIERQSRMLTRPRQGELIIEDGVFRWQEFFSRQWIQINMDDARKLIANPTKNGIEPTDKELELHLRLNAHRGLDPFVGDSVLVGYDSKDGATFSTIVTHQAMLKRAEAHPQYAGMESGVLVFNKETRELEQITGDIYYTGNKDDANVLVGGWARVYRYDRLYPAYATARLSAYEKAYKDRDGKKIPYGHWAVDGPWMIHKCAQAKGLRASFPNDLGGMKIQEERDMDTNAIDAEVEPLKSIADKL